MRRACSIEDCKNKAYARSWCVMHYMRWRRTGDPLALKWDREREKNPKCKRGHSFSGDNLRVDFVRGRQVRVCRTCSRDAVYRLRAKRRAARGEA